MALADEVKFCTRCGGKLKTKACFGQKRPVCPDCGWIYFSDPKVAAAVLVEQDGCVLLVRRINQPYRGLWSLPAGFVNAGEDPARAAERECFEETGLSVRVTDILDIYSGREHARGSDFIIFYQAEILGGSLAPADDVDRAEFFSRAGLPELAFEATSYILDQF